MKIKLLLSVMMIASVLHSAEKNTLEYYYEILPEQQQACFNARAQYIETAQRLCGRRARIQRGEQVDENESLRLCALFDAQRTELFRIAALLEETLGRIEELRSQQQAE